MYTAQNDVNPRYVTDDFRNLAARFPPVLTNFENNNYSTMEYFVPRHHESYM